MKSWLALLSCIAFTATFSSCLKKESAIVLPPPPAKVAWVDMGIYYDKQIFFDFESGQAVFTSNPASWDLAFEASDDGRHVFENGGKSNVYVFNTHATDLNAVTELPPQLSVTADTFWQYDNPNGLPSGTAIGQWWNTDGSSKREVYIVRMKTVLYKMQMLAADEGKYVFQWMPFYGKGQATVDTLTKDSACNYVYFSFKGGIVKPEPPDKKSWDIVFTQYRELVFDNDVTVMRALPYVVTGALLNPCSTQAADDSTEDFSAITASTVQHLAFSSDRNAIGYDWKTVDINMATGGGTAAYAVNPHKNYIVCTREGYWYKLHFLSFYNPQTGQKGSPMFEYERLK